MALKGTRKNVHVRSKVVHTMTYATRSMTEAEIDKAKKEFADQGIALICVEYNPALPRPTIERVHNA